MPKHGEEVQKLKDFLKKKGVNLSEVEIEAAAQNLYELGLFLVRLKLKQHSSHTKSPKAEGFEQITREPP